MISQQLILVGRTFRRFPRPSPLARTTHRNNGRNSPWPSKPPHQRSQLSLSWLSCIVVLETAAVLHRSRCVVRRYGKVQPPPHSFQITRGHRTFVRRLPMLRPLVCRTVQAIYMLMWALPYCIYWSALHQRLPHRTSRPDEA